MSESEIQFLRLEQKDEEQQREIDELKNDVMRLLERVQVLEARLSKSAAAFSEDY